MALVERFVVWLSAIDWWRPVRNSANTTGRLIEFMFIGLVRICIAVLHMEVCFTLHHTPICLPGCFSDDCVMPWNRFPLYRPLARGIHRSLLQRQDIIWTNAAYCWFNPFEQTSVKLRQNTTIFTQQGEFKKCCLQNDTNFILDPMCYRWKLSFGTFVLL